VRAVLYQPRRLLGAAFAVMLGVVLVAEPLLLIGTLTNTLTDATAGTISDAAVVLTPGGQAAAGEAPAATVSLDVAGAIRALPAVSGVRGTAEVYTRTTDGPLLLRTLPTLSARTTLKAGRLPTASGEGALSAQAADNLHKGVGDTVAVDDVASGPRQVRVVGVVVAASDAVPKPSASYLFALDADVQNWSRVPGYFELVVLSTRDPAEVREAVAKLAPVTADSLVVRTRADEQTERVSQFVAGSAGLVLAFLGFMAIALFVSSQVVANTFTTLVSQRTRELALLRRAGATRRQVFGSVVAEAALLGLVANVGGVAAGVGLVALPILASQGTRLVHGGLALSPIALGLPVVVGVAVAAVGALPPARWASRVPPEAALGAGTMAPFTHPGPLRPGSGALGRPSRQAGPRHALAAEEARSIAA